MKKGIIVAALAATLPGACLAVESGIAARIKSGGKAEFVPSDGGGQYLESRLTLRLRDPGRYRLSLSESIISQKSPMRQDIVNDPAVALSTDVDSRWRARLILSPGLSPLSREANLKGTAKAEAAYEAKIRAWTVGLLAEYTRAFFQYTIAADGRANAYDLLALAGSLEYAITDQVSISLSSGRQRARFYAGSAQYAYENDAAIAWQFDKRLTFELGLETRDQVLLPSGADNGSSELYQPNKSEIYVSATYAH